MDAKISQNALEVLRRRYFAKDENGNPVENADDMFLRVANCIAAADAQYDSNADTQSLSDRFYNRMVNLEFMPNSPTLMNAGRPLGQLSACFVLPVPDSMEEIFETVKNAALIHKSGGGTGFSFSRLRASGASVRSTGGVASGPISFMRVFNAATEAVKQGGTRRGANMGILRVDHPDVLSFIQCKRDTADITNFNISVGLTEPFMDAVKSSSTYTLYDPRTKTAVQEQDAREVFDLIVEMAWTNGEPGIVFLDRINRTSTVQHLGEVESTNPCGEQPLLPYESCNLGSINLVTMVKKGKNGQYKLDETKLAEVVTDAVHFLDNVIDANTYPLPLIAQNTRLTRKVGLGVMGFADLLFMLGIPYSSDEGIQIAKKVMSSIQKTAYEASKKLAKKRGNFPAWEGSSFSKTKESMRNATVTTIAPTGTISIICNASSGIEPLFALAFVRNVMDNTALPEVHPYFEQVMKERGLFNADIMRRVAQEGTVQHIEEIPEDIRRVFVTAHDITPEHHVLMQAAFQDYTDNAVSKTVNFPSFATREEVREVFMLAFELGCKGVTIYRDGSRSMQVLNVGTTAASPDASTDGATYVVPPPRPRPEVTMGITEKVRIGCGTLFVTVNYDEQGICEIFTNLGRAGGCPSQSEATARVVSIALRSGMDAETLIDQLKGIRCHSTIRQRDKGVKVLSCPDAIGRVLEKVVAMQKGKKAAPTEENLSAFPLCNEEDAVCSSNCGECALPECKKSFSESEHKCPDCGAGLEHESGCMICRACGYSKCG